MTMQSLPALLPQIDPTHAGGYGMLTNQAPFAWESMFDWGGNNGMLGNTFNGPQGMLGGFSTLAGFGSNLMNMYGGWKQAQLAQDMWDTQKDYLSMNSWNQGVLADERRAKQRAASNSAQNRPVDKSYLDNPEKIRRKI